MLIACNRCPQLLYFNRATGYSLVLFSKHWIVLLWRTVTGRVRVQSCCSKSYTVTLSLKHFWKNSTNYTVYTGICLERANVKSSFCNSVLQLTCTLLYINFGCSDSFSPSNEILSLTFCSDFIMFLGMKQNTVMTKLSFMFIVKCHSHSLFTYCTFCY